MRNNIIYFINQTSPFHEGSFIYNLCIYLVMLMEGWIEVDAGAGCGEHKEKSEKGTNFQL